MCFVCGDAQHETQVSRRDFLRTGALAALVPWSIRAARMQGQYPIAQILSCSDSRVAPELLFDQGPGDLFVMRVAGNVVSPNLLASIEYGAQFLGAPLIMVLGHSGCGAVDAAIKVLKDKAVLPGHLSALIAAIKPAVIVAEKT